MRRVVFLPEVEQEMFEAALYYQSQTSGLGADFLYEVEHALKFIMESPNTYLITANTSWTKKAVTTS